MEKIGVSYKTNQWCIVSNQSETYDNEMELINMFLGKFSLEWKYNLLHADSCECQSIICEK